MKRRFGGIFLLVSLVLFFTSMGYSEERKDIEEKPEMVETVGAPVDENPQGTERTDAESRHITEDENRDRNQITENELVKSAQSSHTTSQKEPSYSVQVEACLVRKHADEVIAELRGKGYEPYLFQALDTKQVQWYTVRLGDYEDLEKATEVASLFENKEKMPAVITYRDSLKAVRTDFPASESPTVVEERGGGNPATAEGAGDVSGDEAAQEAEESGLIQEGAIATVIAGKEKASGVISQSPAVVVVASEDSTPETPRDVQENVQENPGTAEGAGDVSGYERPQESEETVVVDEETGMEEGIEEGGRPEDEEMGEKTEEGQTDESGRLRELQEQMEILTEEVRSLREEAEARKKLELTEEERGEREKEILEAAGREYTLAKKGTLAFEYSLAYSYFSSDVIQQSLTVEHISDHSLTNSVFVQYAMRDNMTFSTTIPFVYQFDKVGTTEAREVTDLGDVSFGLGWQPLKSGGKFPTAIVNGGLTVPLGRSPYEIVVDKDLSTGSGFYSARLGVSLSRSVDPIMTFGSLSYTYKLDVKDIAQRRSGGRILEGVTPGNSIGFGIGIGYALSYKVSLNMSYSYNYTFETTYYWKGQESTTSGTGVSSTLSVGTGWRLTPTRSINFGVGIGLTDNASDFSFSLRIPFEFLRGRK